MTEQVDKPARWGDQPVTMRQWWKIFIITICCVATAAAGWRGLVWSVIALTCLGLVYVTCAVIVWRTEPMREARIMDSWKKEGKT